MKAGVVNGENTARIIGGYGDNCRNGGVRYRGAGGRRLDKPKLNFRFHNGNTPEALARVLLDICIDANMERIEAAIKRETAAKAEKTDKRENER